MDNEHEEAPVEDIVGAIPEFLKPEEYEKVDDAEIECPADSDGDENPEDVEMDPATDGPVPGDWSSALLGHQDAVFSVDIHPKNPDICVTGGGDDHALLWNIAECRAVSDFAGHSDSVIAAKFSSDGEFIATAGMDGSVKIWKYEVTPSPPEPVLTLEGPEEITWIDWHPKGNVILAGGNDGNTYMWGVPTGVMLRVFSGHSAPVTSGGFSKNGKLVITGSEDASLLIHSPKTGETLHRIQNPTFHTAGIISIDTNNDSSLILTGGLDGNVFLVAVDSGKIVGKLEGHKESVECVKFCPTNNDFAVSGSGDSKCILWYIPSKAIRGECEHLDGIVKVDWMATDNGIPVIISCSIDKTVRLWDGRSAELLKELKGHRDTVLDFAVKGSRLISCGDDGFVLCYDIFTDTK